MYLATVSHAPKGTSIDLGQLATRRHLISGIDCAIAGAATEAVAILAVAALLAFRKRRLVCWAIGAPVMQRDLPLTTSMVSFPPAGNQLFTRRWMPWFALALKPRGTSAVSVDFYGTAAPREVGTSRADILWERLGVRVPWAGQPFVEPKTERTAYSRRDAGGHGRAQGRRGFDGKSTHVRPPTWRIAWTHLSKSSVRVR